MPTGGVLTVTGRHETTEVLAGIGRGDPQAADRLFPIVYEELRELAERYFRRLPAGTLQPTALVHEAYLRLVDRDSVDFRGQAHFKAAAARAMRHILIDRSRRRRAAKRGGGAQRVPLDEAALPGPAAEPDVAALHEALEDLGRVDPRRSRVVELRFFGGLSIAETAEVLGIARATVANDWQFARAWVLRRLAERP